MSVSRVSFVFGAALALSGCKPDAPSPPPAASASAAESSVRATGSATPASASAARPLGREGQALVRSPSEAALWVADEDHSVVRRVALNAELTTPPPIVSPPTVIDTSPAVKSVPMPGRPAQLLALADRMLVTIRDPGMLVVLASGDEPHELGRVALPTDAWGLAISPDLRTAYVTSAWTHKLSAVDLGAMKVGWTIDVAREPRGVAVAPDGKTVYVTHLVGAPLTVVDASTAEPKASRIPFPPDPMRTRYNETLNASLGYAALLSPDGRRLFVARHALGSVGDWQGSPTVDVFSTTTGTPIGPVRTLPALGTVTKEELENGGWAFDGAGPLVGTSSGNWVQPRALAYRQKTRHLLVASEGMALLTELDAMSIAPGLVVNRQYVLGGLTPTDPTKIRIPPRCGAPTGVALSANEDVAWVYCRSTDNLTAVRLTPDGARGTNDETTFLEDQQYKTRLSPWGAFAYAAFDVRSHRSEAAEASLPEDEALGRRLFYDATDPVVSGGIGCAGCHPEGRDDGHTWRERDKRFIAGPSLVQKGEENYGMARQTPMLAGRVDAIGPYGWHGESPDIVARIKASFDLHRSWDYPVDGKSQRMRAEPLAVFLRKGLVPPPREQRPLTAEEEQGKAIFASAKAQCATCHTPEKGYTDRSVVPLRGFKARPLFDEDPQHGYKVPSLLFVAGTAPYYHDGSFETLDDLVNDNQDRMGHTMHLSTGERAALVAFLRTL